MVVVPVFLLCELVELELEEEDLARGSGDEGRLVDQEHLAQVLVVDLLEGSGFIR